MSSPDATEPYAAVTQAIESWSRRLIDLSRRNNLLYYRDLKNGTLDLSTADGEPFSALMAGKSVPLSHFLPSSDTVKAAAVAREIFRRAQTNLEEKGLETLYVAMGMATWAPADEGRPPEAAVLLLPVALEIRGGGRNVSLQCKGEVKVNDVLLHVLEVEHGCKIDPEALLPPKHEEAEPAPFDPQACFAQLRLAARQVKGFDVQWRLVLGNFSFQKLAMVKDLREHGAELVAHEIIAAMAGYTGALEQIRAGESDVDMAELDQTSPDLEFHVLDADSSQQRVAALVLKGQSTVIQGPPGTGKSQTIANMIAALAANGRRVLFVAEKRAALEVVQSRLEQVGLGHLALDLHGADLTRHAIMRKIATNLGQIQNTLPVESADLHRRLVETRKRLVDHVRRMHVKRLPLGRSVYAMQGELLGLPSETVTAHRWRDPELSRLTVETAARVEDLLQEASGFASLVHGTDLSPWSGATLTNGQMVQQAVDLVGRLNIAWPAVMADMNRVVVFTGLRKPRSAAEAGALVKLVQAVTKTLDLYSDELYQVDPSGLLNALSPANEGGLAYLWALGTNGQFRHALKLTRTLRKAGGAATVKQLYAEVEQAADQLARWQALAMGSAQPKALPPITEMGARLDRSLADLHQLAQYVGHVNVAEDDLDEVGRSLAALGADTATPHSIASLWILEHEVTELGAGSMLVEIRRTMPKPELWSLRFRHAWLASFLDRARLEDPALLSFRGRTHDSFVLDFGKFDRQRIVLAANRVRRMHAEHAIAAMNTFPEQAALVRREAEKKSRHKPLRKLLAEAPDVLTKLFPCFMASPLSVSQLIDADQRYFDVILFDEASQVLPEDAVPAIMRGSQLVVAGDEHQLPPSTFFADGADEEESDESAVSGFESLLKLTAAFLPQKMLLWHYRSKDEGLIAFSNRHIYNDQLVTFPSAGGGHSVTHVLVDQLAGVDGQEESAGAEVTQVVELILAHAENHPEQSLGVITMGIKHAQRVQGALDSALHNRPELEPFFDPNRQERFFIKNLERVQGDERDAIILSIGYGKDRSGRLPYRFGPLLTDGGERRLNVAVTRAKQRMTLVSSFTHMDMDPGRSKARGVELLRLYLAYAAAKGSRLGDSGQSTVAPNEFEEDVRLALAAKGITLLPQWGASVYRIDLVAQHPLKPGRFVMAIECDGATYHSSPTARDRDRLRQQHLEALGWRFHRIWSTDWFTRKDEEIARAVAAYERAVVFADEADAQEGVSSTVAAPVVVQSEPEVAVADRAPRPAVPVREQITAYSEQEMVDLIQWIRSDGRLRTDDEILDEMVAELGFGRRGARIEAAIRQALQQADPGSGGRC